MVRVLASMQNEPFSSRGEGMRTSLVWPSPQGRYTRSEILVKGKYSFEFLSMYLFLVFCINPNLNPNPNMDLSHIGTVSGPVLKF
jgi:hypothetical protein